MDLCLKCSDKASSILLSCIILSPFLAGEVLSTYRFPKEPPSLWGGGRPVHPAQINTNTHAFFYHIISVSSKFSHRMQISAPTLRVNGCFSLKKDVNGRVWKYSYAGVCKWCDANVTSIIVTWPCSFSPLNMFLLRLFNVFISTPPVMMTSFWNSCFMGVCRHFICIQ